MKMTFEIPVPIALRFKASVPKGQRSPMVAVCLRVRFVSLKPIWKLLARRPIY